MMVLYYKTFDLSTIGCYFTNGSSCLCRLRWVPRPCQGIPSRIKSMSSPFVLGYNRRMKLNAKELRTADELKVQEELKKMKRHPLYLILEDVYDTYNVGGLFRLADALTVSKLYLCGQTEIPPNHKIQKASIGTYKVVPWAYKDTVKEAVAELPSGTQIVAVEQDPRSVPYTHIPYRAPVALIVGNETTGVSFETLGLASHIAEIPMWGINKSLNVIVSAAIVSYHVMKTLSG
jgi:23S rRNA (guanosine2251-2'-O)-methyltransferase